jgi:putative endonuclease
MITPKRSYGDAAEAFVADHLIKAGFVILQRNYAKQFGEIDLIACKDNLLIFVEVKMRHNPYMDLSEVITPSKQKKIITVAKYYLTLHNHNDKTWRFDVALVEQINGIPQLCYLPDAFTANF